jgi:hypothetical protein
MIRTELTGLSQATAAGIAVTGRHAPTLSLCRALIEAGHDPAAPLEAYRGTTLCLRVRSIGEGAALTVRDGIDGKPRFAPYRAFQDSPEICGGRPPVRQTAENVL